MVAFCQSVAMGGAALSTSAATATLAAAGAAAGVVSAATAKLIAQGYEPAAYLVNSFCSAGAQLFCNATSLEGVQAN